MNGRCEGGEVIPFLFAVKPRTNTYLHATYSWKKKLMISAEGDPKDCGWIFLCVFIIKNNVRLTKEDLLNKVLFMKRCLQKQYSDRVIV